MAFVVEHLTEQDRLRYNTDPDMLDLSKIPLKRWITDQERGISIWGGMHNHHWMAMAEGDDRWQFQLRYKEKIFKIIIWPRDGGSRVFSENPYVQVWGAIESIFPADLHGLDIKEVIDIVKDALTAFSYMRVRDDVEGQIIVEFDF